MKILQELFAQGIISESDMNAFEKKAKDSGKTEEDIILAKKIVPEDYLFELKSKVLGIPLKKIKPEDVLPDVLELMPEEASFNYKMTPLSKNKKENQILCKLEWFIQKIFQLKTL